MQKGTPDDENRPSGEGNSSRRVIPIHPILFAVYFVVSMLGQNITQMYPQDAVRSLLIVLGIAGILLVIMRLIYRDWQRGALAANLLLLLFFTYGHVYNFLEKNFPDMGRHRLLLPIYLVVGVIGLWLIGRKIKNPQPLTKALNIASLVILIFPLFQIVRWEVLQARAGGSSIVSIPGMGDITLEKSKSPPDVYFIVVDMYGRQDVLNEVYDYDNSAFVSDLGELGFKVTDCSQSNYSQTEMVLASILNLNYLDELGEFNSSTESTSELRHLIQANAVMDLFKDLGYKLVTFETGFAFSEFHYADHYLSPKQTSAMQFGRMNIFEALLIKSTLSLALTDFVKILPSFIIPDTNQPLETKRQQVLFDLEKLPEIPAEITGPKFVFAHILALHEPFVFSSEGEAANYPESMSVEQQTEAYRNQLDFVNSRLLPVLEKIIEESDPKPIIILQGDTGPSLVSHSGRMSILNALYLPGYEETLSSTFTPVNNFRLILDEYFGTHLGMLADNSFFSLYTSPFDFEPVPNDCISPDK